MVGPQGAGSTVVFDVANDVAYGLKFFGFFIGDFDAEFFFECHDEFDGVEGVGTKVFNEFGICGDLIGVDAELLNDDIFNSIFGAFI